MKWSTKETLWIYQRLRIDASYSAEKFQAGMQLSWKPVSYNNRILGVSGICLDTINRVGNPFTGDTITIAYLSTVLLDWKNTAMIGYAAAVASDWNFCLNTSRAVFHDGACLSDAKDIGVLQKLAAWLQNPEWAPFIHSNFCTDLLVSIVMRNFIVTEKGHFGLGPVDTQPGDEVWVLAGGNVPFVLRKLERTYDPESGGPRPTHTLVGACYVNDVMDGKAAKLRDKELASVLLA